MTLREKNLMFRDYPDALDSKQVCEMLGISKKLLYKAVRSGEIPAIKIGRTYKFAKLKIVEYLLGK